MAIIECPECNNQISENADACPNCGNPMRVQANHNPKIEVKPKEGCFLQTLNAGCMIIFVIVGIFILAVLFSGCSTSNGLISESQGGFQYFGIDFRDYTDENFLFTPEKPVGEYESIGLIRVKLDPGIKEISANLYQLSKDEGTLRQHGKIYTVHQSPVFNGSGYYAKEIIDIEPVIKEMYKLATSWGADAIVNFTFNNNNESYSVSGFAIKRGDSSIADN